MHEVNLALRRLDPLGGFLLKGVEHPDIRADLNGIDDAERMYA